MIYKGMINGYRIYVDTMTGEKLLLTWKSVIGQFVHPVGGEGAKGVNGKGSLF